MGRPLKKKFFGNRNTDGSGLGGEGVASVTLGGVNNSTGYTTGDAVTFSAPDLADGTTATGTVVATAGVIDSITITNAGKGYTSAPTVTAPTGTIGTLTLTAVVTTSNQNAITFSSFVTGGSNQTDGDIVKQTGARTFMVSNSDGDQKCKLVAKTPNTAGEMMVNATDSTGATYYVTKISGRKATLTQYGGGAHEFTDGTAVRWTLSSPTLDTTVQLDNG